MVFSIIQLERARASSWAVLQKSARKPRCLQAGDEWPPPAKKPWQARQVNGVLVSQRWPSCACGIGPVQRDLYSAARRESRAYARLGNDGCCETRYFATGLLPGRAA